MEPMTTALLIGGAANVISNIFGANEAAEQAARAEKMINEAIARVQALPIPDITKKIIYDQYMSVGDFTPMMLDKVIEEHAPVALLKEDPRYKARMEATLAEQEQRTKGPSAQFELGLEKSRRRTAQDVLAQMASIESEAKRTGTFGAGASIASKLKAAQAGADRQSMEGLEAAASAEQLQGQNLESFIRNLSAENSKSMDVQSQNVRARNLRDEQLMQNAMTREQANKGALNNAALRNLQEKQKAYEANVGTNIAEQRRIGYEAPMKMFEMNMNKLNAENALRGSLANTYMGRGQAAQQAWSNIGSGIMQGAMAYAMPPAPKAPAAGSGNNFYFGTSPSSYNLGNMDQQSFNALMNSSGPNASYMPGYGPPYSDISLKENIEHVGNDDATGLPIYDFNYKGDKARYRGVMAHDVERVMPQAVSVVNGKKAVDYNMLGMKLYKLS